MANTILLDGEHLTLEDVAQVASAPSQGFEVQVDLTEEGQIVYSYAEKIFALSDELEKEFADLYNLHAGTLKIGVAHVTLKNLVPNLIPPRS